MIKEINDGKFNYIIRKAIPSDFDQIFKIWLLNQKAAIGYSEVVTNNDSIKEKFWNLFNIKEECFFFIVAQRDNEILGWQSCLPFENNPNLYIEQGESSTYIDYRYAAKGIGYQLLKTMLEILPQTTIKMYFGKVVSKNKIMLKIGEELGWRIIGLIPSSYKYPKSPETYLLYYNVPEEKKVHD